MICAGRWVEVDLNHAWRAFLNEIGDDSDLFSKWIAEGCTLASDDPEDYDFSLQERERQSSRLSSRRETGSGSTKIPTPWRTSKAQELS